MPLQSGSPRCIALVANLDVPVTPDPLSDGREQLLDALLLCRRLDHALTVGFSLLPQIPLVGLLPLRKLPLDSDLDAEFFQVRE
jgi:hypothetical protein